MTLTQRKASQAHYPQQHGSHGFTVSRETVASVKRPSGRSGWSKPAMAAAI